MIRFSQLTLRRGTKTLLEAADEPPMSRSTPATGSA